MREDAHIGKQAPVGARLLWLVLIHIENMRHISLGHVCNIDMSFEELGSVILKLVSLINVLSNRTRAQDKLI